MKYLLFSLLTLMFINQSCDIAKQSKPQTKSKEFFNDDSESHREFQTEQQTDFVYVVNGKEIYELKCSSCHVKFKDDFILAKSPIVQDRNYFERFINNEDSLISVGDPMVLAVKKSFRNYNYFHEFNFTKSEIETLRNFIMM